MKSKLIFWLILVWLVAVGLIAQQTFGPIGGGGSGGTNSTTSTNVFGGSVQEEVPFVTFPTAASFSYHDHFFYDMFNNQFNGPGTLYVSNLHLYAFSGIESGTPHALYYLGNGPLTNSPNLPGLWTNNGAGGIGWNSNITASSVKVLGVAGVDTLDQITVTTGQTTPPFTVFDTNGTAPLIQIWTNGDLTLKGKLYPTNGLASQTNVNTVRAGQSTSNTVIGGTWFKDQTAYTNVSATPTVFTNIGQIVIPSNMLTNNGDVVKGYWKIAQRLATPGTNEFKMVGTNSSGNTYLDTGLQITSNGVVYAYLEAERINANTISVVASLDWNGTQGRLFDRTNGINRTYVLDTGTNNTFALQVAAQAVISVTNISLRSTYEPAPF